MSELKNQALQGVRWTTLSAMVLAIGGLVQVFALTRLLSPSDFGAMALVNIALGLSMQVVDMGFSNAIIQGRNISNGQLNALFWLNTLMGILMAVFLWLLAPFAETLFQIPGLAVLLRWITPAFILGGLAGQTQALFQKDLQFKLLAGIEITAFTSGFFTALFCALWGFGVWSLVAGALIRSLLSSSALLMLGLKRHGLANRTQFDPLGSLLHFGLYQVAERLVGYVTINLDSLLIGRFLGPSVLGIYDVMKRLLIQPWYVINPVITKVTFPVLSKVVAEQERFTNIALRSINLVAVINVPIYVACTIGASFIVGTLFDARWIDGTLPFQWLSVYFLIRALLNPLGVVAMAKGKANISLLINIIVFFGLLVAIMLTHQSGLEAILKGMLVTNILLILPFYWLIVAPYLKIGWITFFQQMMLEMALALLSFGFSYGLATLLEAWPVARLVVFLAVGSVVYGTGLMWTRPHLLQEAKQILQR